MNNEDQEEVLRKRGWSIQSEGTQPSQQTIEPSQQEKLQLLETMPDPSDGVDELYEGISTTEVTEAAKTNGESKGDENPSAAGSNNSNKKRPRTNETETTTDNEKKQRIPELAKSRLSKWAARLFDPDRPKGLIQPPQTIPLNDEFLKQFGQREKEYDRKMGITLDIDHEIKDEEDQADTAELNTSEPAATSTKSSSDTKVKISNLKYTTTGATLQAACARFGPVSLVNLLMDKEKQGGTVPLNTGRAYVTFEDPAAAQACIEGLTELEGRPLRVSLAASDTGKKTPGRAPARYWMEDISTKCFRCGQVGHREADCPNEAKPKPCPLCTMTDHDMRSCPIKVVCFNCGIPGHASRNCNQPRGMPIRRICTVCFQSGHHKTHCRRGRPDAAPTRDAVCMVCGQTGHYLCKNMKWFFGLQGVTCSNCGRAGHIGPECDRPNLEVCSRNEDLARQEIDRAGTWTAADENASRQQQGRGGAGNDRGRRMQRDDDRRRVQSMPPRGRSSQMNQQRRDQQQGQNNHKRF